MVDKQQFKRIPIADLKLDLYNPRLPKSKQGKDEKTVIEYMLLEAATLELMLAIGENDFFAGELLLVVSDENDKGKFTVIEGNRRLIAVKILNNPTLATVKKFATKEIVENAKFKPIELPCLIFENKNDILKYLGYRHITGIKSWRLLEKARYLYEFRNTEDFEHLSFTNASREIAKVIGSSAAYVKRLLISFELYKKVEDEAFYQIDGLNDTSFFLNYFTDSLNKDNIRNFIGIDINSEIPLENIKIDNLEKLTHWWFKKSEGQSRVLGDSEGLKLLNAVIGNNMALSAFEKGTTIYEAYELTDDVDLQFERKIKESLKSIEQADILSNRVKSFYSELYEDLKNIRRIAGKINDFKTKREQDGDDF
ncbi:MAG: hypothetical protein LBB85_00345 [Dysgonamonadaceae bacterium]|jgi:hypothetical protein|nr:hypothetical protein [Dysgonamonadaceae bacterium]